MSVIATQGSCCINAFRAVRSGHLRCLAAMSNDQLQERDLYQQTPLHIAAKLGQLGAIDVLMKRVPQTADAISLCGENPSLLAVGEGQSRCIERLLSGNLKSVSMRAMQRDINGTSILMAAVAREDNDTALWLLRTFGKPLAMLPNSCRMLPLHVAASTGNIEFIRIATKYDSQMANYRDVFGCTPALYAVQGGYLTCLRYLVEKAKSDISAVSDKGQSLLHVACLGGHAHIVRWIMQRSVPNAILWPTKDGANAIHCAAYSGSVVALGVLLEAIRRKKRRAVLAIRDSLGNTPLHLAAVNNHVDAAHFLLAKGASPLLTNAAGQTAEDISRMKSHIQLARLLRLWKDKRHRKNGRLTIASKGDSVNGTLARYSSGYGSALSQTLATESSRIASPPLHRQLSSGYSSCRDERILRIYSGEEYRETRPLSLIASDEDGRIYSNLSCQTDPDPLDHDVRVVGLDSWRGEGLSAFEQIDKVENCGYRDRSVSFDEKHIDMVTSHQRQQFAYFT
uniref:ANK_REP_REGION domain-containing protein n=1 Tax=Ascaris lumbricoides TaxID=6252 RepID=A0A0M3HZF2_ASCLU